MLIVEGGVQNIKYGPKVSELPPFCLKVEFAFKSEF